MDPVRLTTSDGLSLEGEVRMADGAAVGTAVLCHPHPLLGGSKDHPLLWAIRNELSASHGLTVLAFNFRGIMGSEGEYGHGRDELADVLAAVDHVRTLSSGPTLLVGWSFGAGVALRHAIADDRVVALVLIGFPLGESLDRLPPVPERAGLRGRGVPTLLISGAADQLSPAPEVRSLGRKLENARVEIVPNADHYFEKQERIVASLIGEFADETLARQ
jgi:alpha/beta superfamily hydrolase